MSNKLKIFLGISYLFILSAFLYLIFSNIQFNKLDDFSYYKELQLTLSEYVSKNIITNLFYFFIFSIIWVSLLGFASPLLIISGVLFGKWIGTFISTISISIGALILYLMAIFFFSDIVKNLLKDKFSKYVDRFQKNEFIYFFAFRLSGGLGIPFFLQNTLPVLFKMGKLNYYFSTLLGFIPHCFVWNTIGAGINSYIKQSNNFSMLDLIFSREISLPILLFLLLIILSFIIKNKFFDVKNY